MSEGYRTNFADDSMMVASARSTEEDRCNICAAGFLNTLRQHLALLNPTDEIPLDKPLVDLGLDSLAAIELVLDLEDGFAITFPDDTLGPSLFENAAALHRVLAELLAAQSV
jgi:acyl carrier protein